MGDPDPVHRAAVDVARLLARRPALRRLVEVARRAAADLERVEQRRDVRAVPVAHP